VPHLSDWQWTLSILAAFTVGMSKAGFSGLGMVAVVLFASIFGARDSTGIVLPMLIVGDIGAVLAFKQHARWDYIARTLPIAAAGVVIAALIMQRLDNASFRPILGFVILALTALQAIRMISPDAFGRMPHSKPVAWLLGLFAGLTTMMANAAGPVISLHCVAVGMPKFEVVGTLAWFFFIVNVIKVPFSVGLGLIHGSSLMLNLILVPPIIGGLFAGRWLITRLPQRAFEIILMIFAATAATRLLWN
jgi:hypothetical protein